MSNPGEELRATIEDCPHCTQIHEWLLARVRRDGKVYCVCPDTRKTIWVEPETPEA
jgi:hypothetical protein